MCNLNVIIKNKKLSDIDLSPFLMAVTSNSYANNSDGDGFYIGRVIKGIKKIDIYKYREEIFKQNIILSHQRMSTSGFNNDYTQPFENDNFIFMHNGVMSQFVKKEHSDTYILFKRFNKAYKKLTHEKTQKTRIVKTIKKIFNYQNGSFSIVIYDKLHNRIYYFKNSNTNIYFYYNRELIYLTTNCQNERFLNMITKDYKEKKIKDLSIYYINPIDLTIKVLSKIKENNVIVSNFDKSNYLGISNNVYSDGFNKNYNRLMGKYDNDDYNIKRELSYYPHVAQHTNKAKCKDCSILTDYYDNNLKSFRCPDCLSEELY